MHKTPLAGYSVYRTNKFTGSSKMDASDYHGRQVSAQETPDQRISCQHKTLYHILLP